MSRETDYLQKRIERLERELAAAREEIGRLKGPIYVNDEERQKRERRTA